MTGIFIAGISAARFYNLVLADCGAGFFDPLDPRRCPRCPSWSWQSVSIDVARTVPGVGRVGLVAATTVTTYEPRMRHQSHHAGRTLMSQLKTWCGIESAKFNLAGRRGHAGTGTLRSEISLPILLDPIYSASPRITAALSDDFVERAGRV